MTNPTKGKEEQKRRKIESNTKISPINHDSYCEL